VLLFLLLGAGHRSKKLRIRGGVAQKPLWITLLVYKLWIKLRQLVVRSFKIKPQ
jgi:hypothetical protein